MMVRGEISRPCDFCFQIAFRAPALVCRPSEPELSPPQPHISESNAHPGEQQSAADMAAGLKKVEKQIACAVKTMQKGDAQAIKFLAKHGPKCEESKQSAGKFEKQKSYNFSLIEKFHSTHFEKQ